MSKKRKRHELEEQAKSSPARKIITAVLIVAAFAAVIYMGLHKRGHRLDAFARCLATKQATMYGAYWCPHCADQKEMFASSFQYVPYVECGVPGSRDEAPVCKDAGVKHFPTWKFADGEHREGTQTLEALGSKTGCARP
jgi:hypothetical protein